jgi:hypothetical protein
VAPLWDRHQGLNTTSDRPPRPGNSDPRRPRRHQGLFIEDFQGTTPLDDPVFTLHGAGTSTGGSQIRFTSHGHFVLDKRTGEVRHDTNIITCRVS